MTDLARSFPAAWRDRLRLVCSALGCGAQLWTRWGYRRHYTREHPRPLHYFRVFAFQATAREEGGRHIGSGGSHYFGLPYYGFVAATYLEGSHRQANPDAWRCHHEHQDELEAYACALAEVRRLAAGGAPVVCSDWPDCLVPEDIRYARRAAR